MTTRDVESRVRKMTRLEPPVALRARVIDAATTEMDAPSVAQIHRMPIGELRGSRRPAWRTAAVAAITVTFIVVAGCAGLNVWAQRQLDLEIARLQAKYGSLDPATTIPPPVPDADNRALVIRSAAKFVVPFPDGHFMPYPMPSPLTAELRTFANANRDAIGRLGDLRSRQRSNWGIDYWNDLVPPYESLRILWNAATVNALAEIEDGRPDDAARAIVAGLGIAASFRQESDTLASMIHSSALSPQFRTIRRLISDLRPSRQALEELSVWLAENRIASMSATLLTQMKWTNGMFARMERGDIDPGIVSYIYPMTWPDWPSALVRPAAILGRPFVRIARLRALRRMDQVLDSLNGPRPREPLSEPPQPERWALIDRLVSKFTVEEGIFEYGDSGDRVASALAMAEIGVALRRFKLDHVDYPSDLLALVPHYLDRLPIDPYTGQMPVYGRRGSGFVLHASASRPDIADFYALDWDVKR